MNTKPFALIVIIWAGLSLFLTAELQRDIFWNFNTLQAALLWVVISSAPLLALLWIWLFETSPWQRMPVIGIFLLGSLVVWIAFNDRHGEDWIFLPVLWSGVSLLSAYLLKDKLHLNEARSKKFPALTLNRSVQIDHVHYLHQLDEQISIGLPSVARVRSYFLDEIPKVITILNKPEAGLSPFGFHTESPFSHAQINIFMTEKLATELTYLCTIAFLDRVCGPDFRYTKQYHTLKEFFLSLETSKEARPIDLSDPKLKIETIVSASELDAAIRSLDIQAAKKPADISASNVTVSLAGLRHVILSGLLPKEQISEDALGKMVYAAMVQTREIFRNRTTTL